MDSGRRRSILLPGPAGRGLAPPPPRNEAEKTGRYTYVLATVKHVHFDEDDRYYTVVRADTGTEQRTDSGTCMS